MNRTQLHITLIVLASLNVGLVLATLLTGQGLAAALPGVLWQWSTLGAILVAQRLARPFWDRRRARPPGAAALFWRPIAVAPRDGRPLLLTSVGADGAIGETDQGAWGIISGEDEPETCGWRSNAGRVEEPTHFLPWPAVLGAEGARGGAPSLPLTPGESGSAAG